MQSRLCRTLPFRFRLICITCGITDAYCLKSHWGVRGSWLLPDPFLCKVHCRTDRNHTCRRFSLINYKSADLRFIEVAYNITTLRLAGRHGAAVRMLFCRFGSILRIRFVRLFDWLGGTGWPRRYCFAASEAFYAFDSFDWEASARSVRRRCGEVFFNLHQSFAPGSGGRAEVERRYGGASPRLQSRIFVPQMRLSGVSQHSKSNNRTSRKPR